MNKVYLWFMAPLYSLKILSFRKGNIPKSSLYLCHASTSKDILDILYSQIA
jgi:hypothetical protein